MLLLLEVWASFILPTRHADIEEQDGSTVKGAMT
jgi:hypothetical protein